MNGKRFILISFLCSLILWLIFSCRQEVDFEAPSPIITFYPLAGDTSTFFCFDGSGSTDNMSEIWQLQFRWDFNGDGNWDTGWSRETKAVSKFSKFGQDSVFLQVMDHAGLEGIQSCVVKVAPVYGDTTFIDSRDGQPYRAVRIDQLWWMAEDLRYGVEISADSLPHRDDFVEKYLYRDSLNQLITESGFYNWNEATYWGKKITRGICPDGWRLIDYYDAYNLNRRFFLYGSLDFYFKPGGYLGIDFDPQGYYSFFTRTFSYYGEMGFLVISQKKASDDRSRHYVFNYGGAEWGIFDLFYAIPTDYYSYPTWWDTENWGTIMDFNKLGVNVRCVKDIAR